MNPQEKNSDDTFEQCIFCKNETNYKISQPITTRCFYIEGCGQLCNQCYFQHIYSIGNGYNEMMTDFR